MKLKKNNIYFMHFVHPATAMFEQLLDMCSSKPNQGFGRPVYFQGSHSLCQGRSPI